MLDFEKRIESDLVSENNPRIVFDFSHRLLEELEQGLSAVKPAIEDYFSLSLGDQANPHITIWNPGSFIGYHADAVDISASAKSTELRIVVLLFLNDNVDYELKVKSPKTYKGGNLVIYSLMKGEKFEKYGYPIKGKTGNLVAFKANSPHEVTPVISGTRYVLKTGFH